MISYIKTSINFKISFHILCILEAKIMECICQDSMSSDVVKNITLESQLLNRIKVYFFIHAKSPMSYFTLQIAALYALTQRSRLFVSHSFAITIYTLLCLMAGEKRVRELYTDSWMLQTQEQFLFMDHCPDLITWEHMDIQWTTHSSHSAFWGTMQNCCIWLCKNAGSINVTVFK